MPDPGERIERYVRGYFRRHLDFPTVARVARATRLRQAQVVEAVEGADGLMLTYWHVVDYGNVRDGLRFVEVLDLGPDAGRG